MEEKRMRKDAEDVRSEGEQFGSIWVRDRFSC